jgi:hypothetical protein
VSFHLSYRCGTAPHSENFATLADAVARAHVVLSSARDIRISEGGVVVSAKAISDCQKIASGPQA